MDQQLLISEEMVDRYYQLQVQAKKIERELNELKKVFHQYFDLKLGENEKGELLFKNYKLQRQIRISEKYNDMKTVGKLESLNLSDCIQIIKKPDEEKIKAAMALGILNEEELADCKDSKISSAILVRER